MTLQEFHAYVTRDLAETTDEFARDVIRRCYRNISPFDIHKPEVYAQARVVAISEIHVRRLRTQALANARRSVAPALRGALPRSMPDRRAGAEDVDEEHDRLD